MVSKCHFSTYRRVIIIIDLIIILTPHDTHYEIAKEALLQGKNVLIEKPFTVHCSQAKELIELAERKNLILTCFQNRRLDGDFLTVSEWIKEGRLGRIVQFESRFERFRLQPKGLQLTFSKYCKATFALD